MKYFAEWEKSVDERKDLTKAERAKMLLSRETITGLQITGNACNWLMPPTCKGKPLKGWQFSQLHNFSFVPRPSLDHSSGRPGEVCHQYITE